MSAARDHVLFVCTANQCRSPMAEYLYRHHFCTRGRRHCASAGIIAAPGVPASRNAVKAMKELGIDMRGHRSMPVTPDLLERSGTVAVMTLMHRELLVERFPDAAGRVMLLGAFDARGRCAATDIEDPVGLSLDVYRTVRDQIAAALWGLEAWLDRAVTDAD